MKERRAEYWGTCTNCGKTFYPSGEHGKDCGCGYALSAHEPNCWGNDGRTPHPLNPALAPEELAHRRASSAAKRLRAQSGAAALALALLLMPTSAARLYVGVLAYQPGLTVTAVDATRVTVPECGAGIAPSATVTCWLPERMA